jgi:hypothetical protein
MAEKSAESSIRKAGASALTLDRNLSASDLSSVSPHQKVHRAGNIEKMIPGSSPYFKPKLDASLTASPYKHIAPDLDRFRIADSSFEAVPETTLNLTNTDIPYGDARQGRARAQSAAPGGVRRSGRRRLQSARPGKVKRLRILNRPKSTVDFTGDTATGIGFRDVARNYSAKSGFARDSHYIKDYLMHKPKDKHLFRGKDLVRL